LILNFYELHEFDDARSQKLMIDFSESTQHSNAGAHQFRNIGIIEWWSRATGTWQHRSLITARLTRKYDAHGEHFIVCSKIAFFLELRETMGNPERL